MADDNLAQHTQDSPTKGAAAAGMTAIGGSLCHGARLTAAGTDFVCSNWHGISRQLSRLGVPA
ncbi:MULTISPECIES: hypothetical protein [unclassified Mesorhizobium]|uniref:hypothetical protein n=1 Tax=unclassified Mesorhizobium TaxID=325217 RepID=UPI001551A093|nr:MULTISPECIES: hypothetical protein [unclassified Mesorhizobium]